MDDTTIRIDRSLLKHIKMIAVREDKKLKTVLAEAITDFIKKKSERPEPGK